MKLKKSQKGKTEAGKVSTPMNQTKQRKYFLRNGKKR